MKQLNSADFKAKHMPMIRITAAAQSPPADNLHLLQPHHDLSLLPMHAIG